MTKIAVNAYRKTISFALVASAICGVSLAPVSAEACDQIQATSSNYNLASNPQPVLDFVVKRNNKNTLCRWFITIDKGAHNDGTYNRFIQNSPATLPIQIYDDTGSMIIEALPDAQPPNNVISGTFSTKGGGNQQTVHYRFALGTVPFSTSTGTYQNTWQVRLYRANLNNGNYSVANNTNIGAYYNVQPRVDISLTDTGQPFNMWDTEQTLDFGDIENGEELSFDMRIGANRPFRYTINSLNGGNLRRQGGGSGATDNIDYQIKIAPTAYSSNTTINNYPYTSSNMAPPTGTEVVFPVTVRIVDDPTTKNSGSYADTVTITVTAL